MIQLLGITGLIHSPLAKSQLINRRQQETGEKEVKVERRRGVRECRALWMSPSYLRTGQQPDSFQVGLPVSQLHQKTGRGGSRKNRKKLPSRNCTGDRRLGMHFFQCCEGFCCHAKWRWNPYNTEKERPT